MIRKIILHFSQLDVTPLPQTAADSDAISTILKMVFGIAGSIALLVVVIAGFRYIVTTGDPAKMAQAKKAILYALIGLVVALSGFSIVTLVVKGTS